MQTTNTPFLKHLSQNVTPHVIVTAEDEEFDDVFLQDLRDEGFDVHYVAQNDDPGPRFCNKLHALANQITGVSERYAIIAFGDTASAVLEAHTQSTPRLCAIIAYYPTTIPEPTRTHYPMDTSVLLHLAGADIGVRKTPEIVGIQGKRKTVRRNLAKGMGFGGEIKLSCPSYSYKEVGPGFAEHDLDEFDALAHDVAWSRTLKTLREAFGVKVDVERIRDQFVEDLKHNPTKALQSLHPNASALCIPSNINASSHSSLERFYTHQLQPTLAELNARLISRTVGTDRVVDELQLKFRHDREIPWLLPNIPASGKDVDIMVVDIVTSKARKIFQERLYWDHQSLLGQVGMIEEEDSVREGEGEN